MSLLLRPVRPWCGLCLLAGLAVSGFGHASAMEFVCHGVDGGETRLGAPDRSIVIVSRDADGGGCRFSVDGFPSAGPSLWALDLVYGDHRTSEDSGETFVHDLLQRSLEEQVPPVDVATLLLSAGGYGSSEQSVGYDAVRDFAAAFLDDREACVSLIEFSGGAIASLEHGFCGYVLAGGEHSASPVADTLRARGISIPAQYDEGGVIHEQLYFVYGIDTGSTTIAAFFPAES